MRQVLHCSTLLGALTLAAAVDDGRLGGADARRLLLVSGTVPAAEAFPSPAERAAFAAIRDRFDDVVSWNEVIAPLHPAAWTPTVAETPVLARLIGARLGLDVAAGGGVGGVDELVLESAATAPGRSLAELIRDCPITVYADGLRSWGPTPRALAPQTAERIGRLLHLDLVPGVRPLQLREWDVAAESVPAAALSRVTGATAAPAGSGPRALILGQHLAALDVLSAAEEADLHVRQLEAVAAAGYVDVVFKPHPAAGHTHAPQLAAVAAAHGVRLTIAEAADHADVLLAGLRPDLVVSCFSTGVATAAHAYGVPVATTDTELVLERLAPYENPERIPATIVDATAPRLQPDGSALEPPPVDLARLVEAVGYCMNSAHYPELRQAAVDHLAEHGRARYFKKRRLEALELIPRPAPKAAPAAAPPPPPSSLAGSLRAAAAERLRRRSSRG